VSGDITREIREGPDDRLYPGWYLKQRLSEERREDPLRVLSTVEASRELGFKPATWRQWCEEKRIEGAFLCDGRWRIPLTAARAHILRLQAVSTQRRSGPRGPYRTHYQEAS